MEIIAESILKGLFGIMIVFVDKTKANFKEVSKIKKEKKYYIYNII
jgi:hypothetical protein